jgi:hypothetical protein
MTAAPGGPQPKSEDLVAHPSHVPPGANPFAHSANITVSVPETVEVKLVDASALADYEVWIFLTSILASTVTGFLTALVQAPATERSRYGMITIVFAVMMLICGITGILKRRKLSSKTRRIRFRVGEQLPDP